MTLNEKFKEVLINPIWQMTMIDKQMEIAEEFAIGFGEWMTSGVEFIDDTEIGRIYEYKHKKYTTKELLEIYKKENKL